MWRFNVFCCLAVSTCLTFAAEQPTLSARVKKLATDMVDATIRGDFAKVVDHTFPPFVSEVGGRKALIEMVEKGTAEMKAHGFVIKDIKIGEPGDVVVDGDRTYVVVPTVTDIAFPKGILRAKSFLLGISPDEGKSWTFTDGAGLQDEKFRARCFANLPKKLKLPEKTKPELISPKL